MFYLDSSVLMYYCIYLLHIKFVFLNASLRASQIPGAGVTCKGFGGFARIYGGCFSFACVINLFLLF